MMGWSIWGAMAEALAPIPCYAIGGITQENAGDAILSGGVGSGGAGGDPERGSAGLGGAGNRGCRGG